MLFWPYVIILEYSILSKLNLSVTSEKTKKEFFWYIHKQKSYDQLYQVWSASRSNLSEAVTHEPEVVGGWNLGNIIFSHTRLCVLNFRKIQDIDFHRVAEFPWNDPNVLFFIINSKIFYWKLDFHVWMWRCKIALKK